MLNHKIRYSAIRHVIENPRINSICEVGSGSQGLGQYFKNINFVGVDQDFEDYGANKNINPNMNAIKANAAKLPFDDNNFDFVFSLDMLEHIHPRYREDVILELIRVSSKVVIIAFPSGSPALAEDLKLAERFRKKNKKLPGWLQEHISIPYPDNSHMDEILGRLGVKYRHFGNEGMVLHKLVQRFEVATLGFSRLDMLVPFKLIDKTAYSGSEFFRSVYEISLEA